MSLYLIRYGELGLKSPKVKKRFQKTLKNNIEEAFLKNETQCITSMDWGRIYIHSDMDEVAEEILKKIFGITTFSKVVETSSELEEICDTAALYSKDVIKENSTFAVRAKRTGNHHYTSQDVAREVGSAILAANKDKYLKVNLNNPDIKIFVEVRHNKAFVFSKKIPGPGGFPMGTQGKVMALITDKKSIYAAWLMMKRGCRTRLLCSNDEAFTLAKYLEPWQLNFKPIKLDGERDDIDNALDMAKKVRAEALVLGYTFEEFQKKDKIKAQIPIFYPLIGLSDSEINRKITSLFFGGS